MMMDYIERFNEACHDSCVIVLLFFMLYIQNFEGGYYEEAALMAANSPKVTSRMVCGYPYCACIGSGYLEKQ